MITIAELKGLAANRAPSIDEARSALADAADRLEYVETWLRPVVERMCLAAFINETANPRHAEVLTGFAKDVQAAYLCEGASK
jgi:hypothetical protein